MVWIQLLSTHFLISKLLHAHSIRDCTEVIVGRDRCCNAAVAVAAVDEEGGGTNKKERLFFFFLCPPRPLRVNAERPETFKSDDFRLKTRVIALNN